MNNVLNKPRDDWQESKVTGQNCVRAWGCFESARSPIERRNLLKMMHCTDNSLGTTYQLNMLNITAKMIVHFITEIEIRFVWLRVETVMLV